MVTGIVSRADWISDVTTGLITLIKDAYSPLHFHLPNANNQKVNNLMSNYFVPLTFWSVLGIGERVALQSKMTRTVLFIDVSCKGCSLSWNGTSSHRPPYDFKSKRPCRPRDLYNASDPLPLQSHLSPSHHNTNDISLLLLISLRLRGLPDVSGTKNNPSLFSRVSCLAWVSPPPPQALPAIARLKLTLEFSLLPGIQSVWSPRKKKKKSACRGNWRCAWHTRARACAVCSSALPGPRGPRRIPKSLGPRAPWVPVHRSLCSPARLPAALLPVDGDGPGLRAGAQRQLPLQGLQGVADERPLQNAAELLRGADAHPLPAAPGRQHGGHGCGATPGLGPGGGRQGRRTRCARARRAAHATPLLGGPAERPGLHGAEPRGTRGDRERACGHR